MVLQVLQVLHGVAGVAWCCMVLQVLHGVRVQQISPAAEQQQAPIHGLIRIRVCPSLLVLMT
jgi:hypothetical protein